MGKRKEEEEEEEEEETAAWASFPSDLLPEILSRVPYRSLCRFNCVSRAWLALCSYPAVRRRSPQTLSGFFCYSRSLDDRGEPHWELDLLNLSGRGRPLVDPSLRFLCGYEHVVLENSCGGILLCSGWDRALERWVFVVCSPATEDIWAAAPLPVLHELESYSYIKCLCFNPAVPGRFAVFIFLRDAWQKTIMSVQVYSSDTGEYTSMASGWGPRIMVRDVGCVFLNGNLHVIAHNSDDPAGNETLLIATVDIEENTWSTIGMPPKVEFSIIGQSRGRLCGMQIDDGNDCRLSVWVLEDYASGQWTLKHTASVLELLGRPCLQPCESYKLVAIHPEYNFIFLQQWMLPGEAFAFMSYDMDNKKLHAICSLEEYDPLPFCPYIPCFAEQPAVAQNNSELLRIR